MSAGEKIDGRTARARRTREAIVDAMLALLDGGDLRPSAEDIAARAKVSPRSIFQHFGERETLLRAVGMRQTERVSQIVEHLPDDGPLDARIDAFVDQRARVLEFITPVRRSALLNEPFSEGSHNGLQAFRAFKRAETERVFGPELRERPPGERQELARALGAATDWNTWEALRAHQGLSVDDARAVMRRTIVALLRPS